MQSFPFEGMHKKPNPLNQSRRFMDQPLDGVPEMLDNKTVFVSTRISQPLTVAFIFNPMGPTAPIGVVGPFFLEGL